MCPIIVLPNGFFWKRFPQPEFLMDFLSVQPIEGILRVLYSQYQVACIAHSAYPYIIFKILHLLHPC